jgi:two-component system NarL family response regulator
VLLVDPQPFFCEAMASALSGHGVEVVGWTGDELEAAELASALDPDVVLAESDLARGSGLGLVRRLKDRSRVVLLTRCPEGDLLVEAAAAGAGGCVSHATDLSTIARVVGDSTGGRFAVDPDRLATALIRVAARREAGEEGDLLARLTAREREILMLLAAGLDNRAIADRLYLSPDTVRTHVTKILRKLGVHSRTEAARLALTVGEAASGAVTRISGPVLDSP